MIKLYRTAWKEYGKPFLWCFILAGVIFSIIYVWNGRKRLPTVAVILAPHFDDAVLPLGGFMAETKTPVIVITFFGGKPPTAMSEHWDAISGFKNSDEAVVARAKENIRALAEVGARQINLNYLDYQYDAERDFASREKMRQSMEKNIETILDSFAGAKQISIYGPSEFGPNITHPDHQVVHDAFAAAAKRNNRKNVRFFFFEDFPYIERYRNGTATSLKNFLEANNPEISLTEAPIIFGTSTLDKKLKALGDYASQDKAFGALGIDIAKAARDYARGRCASLSPRPYACEVVYEVKN